MTNIRGAIMGALESEDQAQSVPAHSILKVQSN